MTVRIWPNPKSLEPAAGLHTRRAHNMCMIAILRHPTITTKHAAPPLKTRPGIPSSASIADDGWRESMTLTLG
jgi:hypothetical protein